MKEKYMGCIVDMEFKKALMEQYPGRGWRHPDQFKRKAVMDEKRDIPELATEATQHEARRCQDVPTANLIILDNPIWWIDARLNHNFEWEFLCKTSHIYLIRKAKISQLLEERVSKK